MLCQRVLVLAGRRQRLADLAVVAVDGERLEAHLPALQVDLGDVVDRGVLGHVDRLGDGAGDERLHGGHHPDVTHRRDGPLAHGAVEDRVVHVLQARGADDVAVLGDELDDGLDLLGLVAQRRERPRHRLVDDLHGAAADQLLELDQRQVGLDAGGVAVHHQADGAGRGEHRGLRVAVAVALAGADRLGPDRGGQLQRRGVVPAVGPDLVVGGGVLADDPLVGVGVAGVAVVRTDDRGQLGGLRL